MVCVVEAMDTSRDVVSPGMEFGQGRSLWAHCSITQHMCQLNGATAGSLFAPPQLIILLHVLWLAPTNNIAHAACQTAKHA